jgi:hypothetical protein
MDIQIMASLKTVGVNEAGRAAAESIAVLISAKVGKKLTYSQAFIEAEKFLRSALAKSEAAETDA